VRFAIDSNILVYAFVRDDPQKHERASEIMVRAMVLDSVLAAQSVAEFLNIVRRKEPQLFDEARAQALRWHTTFELLDTTAQNIIDGADLAARHKLQLWDSVIWQVVRTAHAVVFLTEDLQDHLAIDGMKVLNPFDAANEAELQNLLRSADEEIQC
jgi:predicted nucleic acid-binding protein